VHSAPERMSASKDRVEVVPVSVANTPTQPDRAITNSDTVCRQETLPNLSKPAWSELYSVWSLHLTIAAPLLSKSFQIAFEGCRSRNPDDLAQKVKAHPGQTADRDTPPILEAHECTAPSVPRWRNFAGTLRLAQRSHQEPPCELFGERRERWCAPERSTFYELCLFYA
jgi:hypothetical protein